MEKTYQPKLIEAQWVEAWEKSGCFKLDFPSAHKNSDLKGNSYYCIMLPPPNVTGSLHMGHGFQHTLMDTLIRYHHMCGFTTLWQGGVDHAGIATQLVVERQLELEHMSRESIGRDKFIEKVWDWKQKSGETIVNQMRRLGTSVDWSRGRFTMDNGFKRAVNTAFIKLYQDGLIYRGKRLVNWDVKLQTAVSDLEVIPTEEDGYLWHIRYYFEDNQNYLVVATTRPETLFGDSAVAVHPEDTRYQEFIGKQVRLPLTNKLIPVIADDYVEPEFGSGCVKITPAHDFNDYEVAKRHHLLSQMINILNKNGTLNEHTPYENMDRFKARVQIIQQLTEQNLLEKSEKYKVKTPRGEKTGEVIEPFLTEQWYVSMKPLVERAKEAAENGQVKFTPENWTKIYMQWLDNIQDWCISRQLWWGHRIPVYYNDHTGEVYVGEDHHKIKDENLRQDEDVLDTWFSAALWPFATLGWPDQTLELEKFFPTNVLVTGFDIIFFWVARMMMFSLYFTDKVPFKEVYITGLIRDQYGHKMSKSKGNVLDPIDLIDGISLDDLIQKRTMGLMNPKMASQIIAHTKKEFPEGMQSYGTDALRFTFCALANTGRDIRFDLGRIGGYRNFCNKIWNAARFVLSKNISDHQFDFNHSNIFDQWILSRCQSVIKTVHENFTQYRFDLIAQALYEFTWYDYCDWYLEFSKINTEDSTKCQLLFYILENILKLLHPIMPFITEEIFQRLKNQGEDKKHFVSIQTNAYPQYSAQWISDEAEVAIGKLQEIVVAIRNVRSESQILPSQKITVLLCVENKNNLLKVYRDFIHNFYQAIQFLAKVEKIEWIDLPIPHAVTAVVNELQIFVPLQEHINVNAEKIRLTKEIQKLKEALEKSRQKLDNPNYISKAPASVVNKERERLNENAGILEKFELQLKSLG